MEKAQKLKGSFEVGDKVEAFYKGGPVQLARDGQYLFTTCENSVKAVSFSSGRVEHSLEEEEDHVTSFAASEDGEWLVVGWRSLLLKQYDLKTWKCTRSWKGHIAPVMSMAFDSSSTLLATGGSDSVICVWDLHKQYCTHNLRGSSGVVNVVRFHPNRDSLKLLTCSVADCNIRVWDLSTSKCVLVLKSHVSAVTSLDFSSDGKTLLSGGRDKVVHVWDMETGGTLKTIPVFESVEGLVTLPLSFLKSEAPASGEKTKCPLIYFATAGTKGMRVWNTHRSHEEPLTGREGAGPEGAGVMESACGLHYNEGLKMLVSVTDQQNIVCFDLERDKPVKQFIGYLDEVLDLRFAGPEEQLLAVATNSEQVKVFQRDSLSCQLLAGHTKVVLCLDVSSDGSLLASSSKDGNVRVWRWEGGGEGGDGGCFVCVGVGTGHTHSVGAVAVSRVRTNFIVSGSEDLTLKVWSLKGVHKHSQGGDVARLKVKYTQLAHDKDINSLDVSPNDKLIVSASQDKTAKLWRASDGEHIGTFRGHRRGVWSVKFSPVDQCVVTASGDSTVKLWAIGNCSCIKTFEGHTNSVLKAVFLTRGMQIASSGSDGLVKLWTIKTNECVTTLDAHTEKIWSLTASSDGETLASGGADSAVCLWKDVTERVESETAAERELQLLREQELSNLLHQKDYVRAVCVAISLDQPHRILKILRELLERGDADKDILRIVEDLREDQLGSLLKYVCRWNQNSRHSYVAQKVLGIVLRCVGAEQLLQMDDLRPLLEGLIPYTERHFQRLSRLEQLSKFVEYTLQCIKLPTLPESDIAPALSSSLVPVAMTTDYVTSVAADSTTSLMDSMEDDVSKDHVTSTTDHVTSDADETTTMTKPEQKLAEAARRNDRLLSRLRRVKAKVGVKLGASGGNNLPVKRRGASGRTKLKRLGH